MLSLAGEETKQSLGVGQTLACMLLQCRPVMTCDLHVQRPYLLTCNSSLPVDVKQSSPLSLLHAHTSGLHTSSPQGSFLRQS